jgi:two-component system phosphate regulon sensor histidine kinase PhoR
MENSNRNRLFSLVSVTYMMLAFVWWTALLTRRNNELFQLKVENLALHMKAENVFQDTISFQKSIHFQVLSADYQKHRRMVVGEGSFLFLGFMSILWMIQWGYRRDIAMAQQRRNFLLSITHELKSPLASIKLILQTILKRDLEKAQVQKLCDSGQKETERLTELVNNLLLSARLDAIYKPVREEINVAQLVEEVIQRFRTRFPNALLEIVSNEVPILRAEKLSLISVLMNLLENAVKYSKGTAEIRLTYRYEKEQFVFEVADFGIGIPVKERSKVFNRFYRIGNEDTRSTRGTGLGLYIVKQIIKIHKGKIQILNNLPKGTIFKIILPS